MPPPRLKQPDKGVNLGARGNLVFSAAGACQYDGAALDTAPSYLRRILEGDCWMHFTTFLKDEEVVYGEDEFEKFVMTEPPRGLGRTIGGLLRICKAQLGDDVKEETRNDAAEVIRLLQMKQGPLPEHGEIGGGHSRVDNINSATKGGTSADYSLRRLKRDRPDLAEKVIAGELSAHGAAIEAGFRKQVVQIPLDVDRAVSALKRAFGEIGVQELARKILGGVVQ